MYYKQYTRATVKHMSKDTTKKMCSQQTRISLCIPTVLSEPLLGTLWVAQDPQFPHADREDWSDLADALADMSFHWASM